MKARVKATGEVIEISEECSYVYAEHYDKSYNLNELEFLDVDVKEKSLPKDDPDYWEKLKHQYAGMAIQGILSSDKMLGILGMQKGKELDDMIGDMSVKIATTLVNRLKEDKS